VLFQEGLRGQVIVAETGPQIRIVRDMGYEQAKEQLHDHSIERQPSAGCPLGRIQKRCRSGQPLHNYMYELVIPRFVISFP
jgi:hypothetical protein